LSSEKIVVSAYCVQKRSAEKKRVECRSVSQHSYARAAVSRRLMLNMELDKISSFVVKNNA